MELACGWRLPGRCRGVALLPGPEYPVAHGSGGGRTGRLFFMALEPVLKLSIRRGVRAPECFRQA